MQWSAKATKEAEEEIWGLSDSQTETTLLKAVEAVVEPGSYVMKIG